MKKVLNLLRDFSHLAFPITCAGCGCALDVCNEYLCEACLRDLPRTRYASIRNNTVEGLFRGRVKVERAASWCYFRQLGTLQRLLHELKYENNREAGRWMGRQFGSELRAAGWNDVDVLLPVPLHADRKRVRGYNQCDLIADGMGEVLELPTVHRAVSRSRSNETQTRKAVYQRWVNVQELFRVDDAAVLCGKHVVLVDDVVTTGATLESLAHTVLQVPDVRISIATLACPDIV